MFGSLREIRRELRDLAFWMRRELPPAEQAASLLQEVGVIENTCAALRILLSGRIAVSTHWQQTGERSAGTLGGPGDPDNCFQGR